MTQDELLFFNAVRKNNIRQVRQLIFSGVDVNAHDEGSALITTSENGCFLDFVEIPAESWGEENSTKGWTALMFAAAKDYVDILEILSEAGANVNEKNNDGWPALMIAVFYAHIDVVTLLIKTGANVNEKNNAGYTALMIAAFNGHKEILEILITQGANINEKNNEGWTVLMLAAQKGNKEVLEILITQGTNINEKNNYGVTALMHAAQKGNKEILEILVTQGANINEKNNYGGTALMHAAQKGNKEVLEILITQGTNINEKDNYGFTALMIAAYSGCKEVIELLITQGANINEKNNDGCTTLMFAAWNGHKEILEILLTQGANINEKSNGGWTALMFAAENGHKEILEFLINAGMKSGISINYFITYKIIKAEIHKKILTFEKKNVKKSFGSIGPNYDSKDINLIEFFKKNNVLYKDKETTSTYLKFTLDSIMPERFCEYYKSINVMLCAGADINLQYDQKDFPPIITAALYANEYNYPGLLKQFLEIGEREKILPEYEKHLYALAIEHKNKETLKLLLALGIKFDNVNLAAYNDVEKLLEIIKKNNIALYLHEKYRRPDTDIDFEPYSVKSLFYELATTIIIKDNRAGVNVIKAEGTRNFIKNKLEQLSIFNGNCDSKYSCGSSGILIFSTFISDLVSTIVLNDSDDLNAVYEFITERKVKIEKYHNSFMGKIINLIWPYSYTEEDLSFVIKKILQNINRLNNKESERYKNFIVDLNFKKILNFHIEGDFVNNLINMLCDECVSDYTIKLLINILGDRDDLIETGVIVKFIDIINRIGYHAGIALLEYYNRESNSFSKRTAAYMEEIFKSSNNALIPALLEKITRDDALGYDEISKILARYNARDRNCENIVTPNESKFKIKSLVQYISEDFSNFLHWRRRIELIRLLYKLKSWNLLIKLICKNIRFKYCSMVRIYSLEILYMVLKKNKPDEKCRWIIEKFEPLKDDEFNYIIDDFEANLIKKIKKLVRNESE